MASQVSLDFRYKYNELPFQIHILSMIRRSTYLEKLTHDYIDKLRMNFKALVNNILLEALVF